MNLILEVLRNLRLDALSFWLGFLAGLLVLFFLRLLRGPLERLREAMTAQRVESELERNLVYEIRLGNDLLHEAQSWHLAAPLFSLDEVLHPPRLLAPPAAPAAYGEQPHPDITDWAIPYLPEWPELASLYNSPGLSLAEALSGENPIAVIGQPGSGKTVTLASLALQIVRHDPAAGLLSQKLALILHVAELALPAGDPEKPLPVLIEALSQSARSLKPKRLAKVIREAFEHNRVVLLLDGLDELSPAQLEPAVNFLKSLQAAYPATRLAVAASPEYLDGLLTLGFVPLAVAAWNRTERESFIRHWGELWRQFIAPEQPDTDRLILTGWLLNNTTNLTPLELTLKAWAAFAGDSIGASGVESIEAYLRRMLHNRSARSRTALEELALQMIVAMKPLVGQEEADAWLRGSVTRLEQPGQPEPVVALPEEETSAGTTPRTGKQKRVRISGALPNLIESGLVTERSGEKVTLAHPLLGGYLAGRALQHTDRLAEILPQPDWSGKLCALQFLAAGEPRSEWIENLIAVNEKTDPLLRSLLAVGRWLRHASDRHAWAVNTLRQCASYLQNENLAAGIKARIIAALAFSGNPSVGMLFRQLLQSPSPALRQLAALGCGVVRESRAVADLVHLIQDPAPPVSRAAMLALCAIEDKSGLEAVASALLSGNETLQRAAAEALANHPEEGHPTLEEASALEQPGIRRAAAYGLGRIRQPWAIEILEKLRAEETQWVVQDAAIQALEIIHKPDLRIPRPLPTLPQTPWLITFAAERGMGVAPGKPAYELLFRALTEGKDEERLAALYYLGRHPDESAVMPVYQTYFAQRGDVREAALDTLWHLVSAGIELPPPIQFGLH